VHDAIRLKIKTVDKIWMIRIRMAPAIGSFQNRLENRIRDVIGRCSRLMMQPAS